MVNWNRWEEGTNPARWGSEMTNRKIANGVAASAGRCRTFFLSSSLGWPSSDRTQDHRPTGIVSGSSRERRCGETEERIGQPLLASRRCPLVCLASLSGPKESCRALGFAGIIPRPRTGLAWPSLCSQALCRIFFVLIPLFSFSLVICVTNTHNIGRKRALMGSKPFGLPMGQESRKKWEIALGGLGDGGVT